MAIFFHLKSHISFLFVNVSNKHLVHVANMLVLQLPVHILWDTKNISACFDETQKNVLTPQRQCFSPAVSSPAFLSCPDLNPHNLRDNRLLDSGLNSFCISHVDQRGALLTHFCQNLTKGSLVNLRPLAGLYRMKRKL